MTDDPGTLGELKELCVEHPRHVGSHDPGAELGETDVRDAAVLERKTEGVFPGEVDTTAPFGLPVGDPIEELGQKKRREHRRRMRGPPASRWVERVELLVAQHGAARLAQAHQEPLVIEKVLADEVDGGERDLFFSSSSHGLIQLDPRENREHRSTR